MVSLMPIITNCQHSKAVIWGVPVPSYVAIWPNRLGIFLTLFQAWLLPNLQDQLKILPKELKYPHLRCSRC